MKEIDLLHLTPETDVEVLVNQVREAERRAGQSSHTRSGRYA